MWCFRLHIYTEVTWASLILLLRSSKRTDPLHQVNLLSHLLVYHIFLLKPRWGLAQIFDPVEEGEYYIKLVLLMTSRNVDVMEFIPALSFTKVLGLGGGYLGLWLGLSLVTIINRSFFHVRRRFEILSWMSIATVFPLLTSFLSLHVRMSPQQCHTANLSSEKIVRKCSIC